VTLQRHTPLGRGPGPQRRTELQRKTPLRRTRSKRARPNDPLAQWCEVAIPGVCTGEAQHRHHIVRRGQGGGDERANTLDICHRCHGHIHGNVAWSKARGYLRSPGPSTSLPAVLVAVEVLAGYVATTATGLLAEIAAAVTLVGLVAAVAWWVNRPHQPAVDSSHPAPLGFLDDLPADLLRLLDDPEPWEEP